MDRPEDIKYILTVRIEKREHTYLTVKTKKLADIFIIYAQYSRISTRVSYDADDDVYLIDATCSITRLIDDISKIRDLLPMDEAPSIIEEQSSYYSHRGTFKYFGDDKKLLEYMRAMSKSVAPVGDFVWNKYPTFANSSEYLLEVDTIVTRHRIDHYVKEHILEGSQGGLKIVWRS